MSGLAYATATIARRVGGGTRGIAELTGQNRRGARKGARSSSHDTVRIAMATVLMRHALKRRRCPSQNPVLDSKISVPRRAVSSQTPTEGT